MSAPDSASKASAKTRKTSGIIEGQTNRDRAGATDRKNPDEGLEEVDGPLNPAADARNMRRIIAEDPEWTLSTVPHLSELCLRHIINNFEYNNKIINRLKPQQRRKVLERIPTDVPLKTVAHLVHEDVFWERCCRARWRVCDSAEYAAGARCGAWKRMFFERNLEEIVENTVPGKSNPARLNETLALSAPYVQRLDLKQLLPPIREPPRFEDLSETASEHAAAEEPETDHVDLAPIMKALDNLSELRLTYGVRECGMNFEWKLFQFTMRDCTQLARCVASCRQLRVLELHRSHLDDERCRVLVANILDHPSLERLNLEHNAIGDRGARAVGKLLNGHSPRLAHVNLSNNDIRPAGALALAHALVRNVTLVSLDLRLNHLQDEGAQALCKALLKNANLRELDLSGNELSELSAALVAQVLLQNSSLTRLDLSCNALGLDGGKQLQEGMAGNKSLLQMDLRLTECGQESEFYINEALERNRERLRNQRLAALAADRRAEPGQFLLRRPKLGCLLVSAPAASQ